MPTPTIPGRARLAAGADDRLEHELLDPRHAVGGDAHLQEAHVLRAGALRHALDVEAVPVGRRSPSGRSARGSRRSGRCSRASACGRCSSAADARASRARSRRTAPRRSAPGGAGSARRRGSSRRRCRCPGRRGFLAAPRPATFLRIVSSTRWPGTDVSRAAASASASRRSCGMSFSAQT